MELESKPTNGNEPRSPVHPNLIRVDDPADPRIEVYQGLRDHVLRQRREEPGGDMDGVFMSEGDIVVERALKAGYKLSSVLIDGKRTKPLPSSVGSDVPIYAAGVSVLQRVTGYHLHRGMLACFARRPVPLAQEVLANSTNLLVTESIANPTNLGVIIRNAVGLGIDSYVLDPTSCDPLYRRTGRVSMGEAYVMPYARLNKFPEGLSAVTDHGFQVLAFTPAPDAVDISELSFGAEEKVALMIGAEGPGLTQGAQDAAHIRVKIPMSGSVDSINVGSASAIAFYALQQSRRPSNSNV
jgi:tRNA G18 (ribose-2'-O)-methylase SpoU